MQKFYDKNVYCWVCDFSKTTGEGNLARLFISKQFKKKKVIEPKNIIRRNSILNYKYFTPIIGIFVCWYYYMRNKKIAYINYLPFWNCIIFFMLPPKTVFGPITGGANFSRKSFYFVRKYIFPILYKISECLLLIRVNNPIFSTSLLKKNLNPKTINNSTFNYIFNYVKKNKKKNKKANFIIYHRLNHNKINLLNYSLIKKIHNLNYKIYVVGDKLKLPYVINLGNLNKTKLYNTLKKIKYSICSHENVYSLFTLDCINNNVKILVNKKYKDDIFKFRDSFIFINSNLNNLKKIINEQK